MSRAGTLLRLLLAGLPGCDPNPAGKQPEPPSSVAAARPKPLTPDLTSFAGWSALTGSWRGMRLLAPFRLRGAFAVTDPSGEWRVHFSQSASSCERFLPERPTSWVLQPRHPNVGRLTVFEATGRGVRARWSSISGGMCPEVPHGTRCLPPLIWEGTFTAAGCGPLDDPDRYRSETQVVTGLDLELQVGRERFRLVHASLADYYEWAPDPARDPSQPPVPGAVLGKPPRLRVLKLSADDLECLVEDHAWRAHVTLHLDPRDDSVLDLRVRTEEHSLALADPKLQFAFLERPESGPVRFRIEARGTERGISYGLKGEGAAQRCN